MSESIGQIAVRTNKCPRCRQWPGEQCVTKNGKRAGYAHSARCAPVMAGWHDGFETFAREVLGMDHERTQRFAASIVRIADKRRNRDGGTDA